MDLFKVVGYQGGDSVMPPLKSLGLLSLSSAPVSKDPHTAAPGPGKGLAVSPGAGAEIIKTENVTKRFGELTAVDRVTMFCVKMKSQVLSDQTGPGKTPCSTSLQVLPSR